MRKQDPVIQKIKGKTQQVVGTIREGSGQGLKGGVQKIKGRVNEVVGDIRLNAADDNEETDTW